MNPASTRKQAGEEQAIVECVPNFSEGRDLRVIGQILQAIRGEHILLLDWSVDPDHNRSVITFAGPPDAVRESAVRGATKAAELIDLTSQKGVHPRIGAADVIPFVPIANVTLAQCAMLARQAGQELWKRARVPSYFYEAAAARPDRARLEDVRRGQFEGLREEVKRDSARHPDVGGPDLHPTAGASAIGARKLLIAFNVYLDSADVAVARAIAREIRGSSGGLHGLKAMGVLAHGAAQVSMNITDFHATPVENVFQMIKRHAQRLRARPNRCELVGLIPEAALAGAKEWLELLPDFRQEEKVLERRLLQPLDWPEGVATGKQPPDKQQTRPGKQELVR